MTAAISEPFDLDQVLKVFKDIAMTARYAIQTPALVEALAQPTTTSQEALEVLTGIALRFRLLQAEEPAQRALFLAQLDDHAIDRLCDSVPTKYSDLFRECVKNARDFFLARQS